MNIFALSRCPIIAAQSQINCHVIKMTTESAQLLASAHHAMQTPWSNDPSMPKLTHINHPCAIWTRASTGNYKWLLDHFIALADEYKVRYRSKNKDHASKRFIDLLCNIPDFENKGTTEFVQAMPLVYQSSNPINGYQLFYAKDKIIRKDGKVMMIYTNREPPDWLRRNVQFTKDNNKYKAIYEFQS